jgi:hypothetical protein
MSKKRVIQVRLEPEIHEFVAERAEGNFQSVPGEVRSVLIKLMRGELGAAAAAPARGPGRPSKHRCGPSIPKGQKHPCYMGVLSAADGRWKAMFYRDSTKTNLGTFDADWEAAQAYDKAARERAFEPGRATVNFPKPGTGETSWQDVWQRGLDDLARAGSPYGGASGTGGT